MINYDALIEVVKEFFSAEVYEEINRTIRKNYPKKFVYGPFYPMLHSTFSEWAFDSKNDQLLLIAAADKLPDKKKNPPILTSFTKRLNEYNSLNGEKFVEFIPYIFRTTRIIFSNWNY